MAKTNTCPVVMYPEGVIVGKVTGGKNAAGKVRHVAKDTEGRRVGTFDTFVQAKDALIAQARGGQWRPSLAARASIDAANAVLSGINLDEEPPTHLNTPGRIAVARCGSDKGEPVVEDRDRVTCSQCLTA